MQCHVWRCEASFLKFAMANSSFTTSLAHSGQFPTNLITPTIESLERQTYRSQLDKREDDIFEPDERDVVVDICQHDGSDQRESEMMYRDTDY